MRRALIPIVVACAAAAHAGGLPRGKRAERPRATHVVVRPVDLDAGGVLVRLAPGVAVAAGTPSGGRARVTVVGPVEVSGQVDARALGARLDHDVDLLDKSGASVGRARRGALVAVVGKRGAGKTFVEPQLPLRGRFAVESSALTAAPRELVLPVPDAALLAAAAPAAIAASPEGPARVMLDAGARVEPLGLEDRGWVKVRTYGAYAIEGWAPADKLRRADGGEIEAAPSRGLSPSHEALVDAPLYADAAGRRPAGTLRGGALVTVGVEASGPRVKVMTHGEVVGELWTIAASLRPLEASVWAEGK